MGKHSKRHGVTFVEILCVLAIVGIVGVAIWAGVKGGPTDDDTIRILEGQGYSDIELTGYDYWGCGKEDTYHEGFTAKGPTGKPVQGVVCGGINKDSTIRLH